MNHSLFKSPAVTPFVECPNCKRLIEYGAESCPTCREQITPDYALASAIVVVHNTQACSLASMIKTAEPAAAIIFFGSLGGVVLGMPSLLAVSLLTPILSISAILLWFIRFGRFRLGDEEFAKAKRDMRTSLKLWIAFFAVQLLLLVYVVRTRM